MKKVTDLSRYFTCIIQHAVYIENETHVVVILCRLVQKNDRPSSIDG